MRARTYRGTDPVDAAIDWINQQPAGQPWMVSLAFATAHTPVMQPPIQLLPPTEPDTSNLDCSNSLDQRVNLKPGQTIVDIGAGTGFFTRRFAGAVGPKGHAIGLDIEPSMVAWMKADAKKLHLKNYQARLVKPDDPALAPHSVDVVFFCDTLHHITNRAAYLQKLIPALKPGGRVVDIDFKKEALPVGPPPEQKLSLPLINAEFHDAGFKLIAKHDLLPYQYFLEFAPK